MTRYSKICIHLILLYTTGQMCSSCIQEQPNTHSTATSLSEAQETQPNTHSTAASLSEAQETQQPFAGLTRSGLICWQLCVLQIVAALYGDKIQGGALKELVDKINKGNKPLSVGEIQTFRNRLTTESRSETLKTMLASDKEDDAESFLYELDAHYNFLDNIVYLGKELKNVSIGPNDKNLSLSELINEKVYTEYISTIGERIRKEREQQQSGRTCPTIKPLPSSLPDQLCVLSSTKCTTHGTAEINIKDLNDSSKYIHYTLNGFIHHTGRSGPKAHYVAYVKRKGKWYKANDAVIQHIAEEAAIKESEGAYLLFYKKIKEI